MKFTLEIDCDGAAFEGDARDEIARILFDVSEQMERSSLPFMLITDSSGELCGAAAFVNGNTDDTRLNSADAAFLKNELRRFHN